MKYLLTLLLLVAASLGFFRIAGNDAHSASPVDTAAVARPYPTPLVAARADTVAYVCDSQTAKFYHRWRNCRGLNECAHGAMKVTKQDAQQAYGQEQCPVCY